MSDEKVVTIGKPIFIKHKENILYSSDEYSEKLLKEMPVLLNDINLDNSQIQEIIHNGQTIKKFTAVTLPDGTQAFIPENFFFNELKEGEYSMKLHDGAIFLPDASKLNDEELMHLQLVEFLDINTLDNLKEFSEISSINGHSLQPQFQIVDSVAYFVCNDVDKDQDLSEISNVKTNDEMKIEYEGKKQKVKHACPRDDCTKVYSTINHLKVHELSHSGLRPYICTHFKCKKTFSTRYSLKAHLRTHTGEKPYKCTSEDCDKSFKTSGDLLKHIRTHTGERPFVCPFEDCGRSFTTSNIRKVHIRTHTGERPFKCPQPKCGKAFASSTNYKNHVRIHSGEKPYVCRVVSCGRRFTEYSSLHKHNLVHSQERLFECETCKKQYRQHSSLILHKKSVHLISDLNDEHNNEDKVLDVLLENSVDMIDQNKIFDGGKSIQIESINVENETHFIVVQDPSQLVTLQTIESIKNGSENSILDTALKELNIQYTDIELSE